ncbi:Protein ClpV1 [Oligella urethralis]|uniref:type VI secretion system ATPase TssH n=1 Tax=Oligella urethralis TaxID=90245 RepID=UPI000E05EBB2|nr:type VI secretion system ATPase TssH [Oligella urethralis]WOS38847.1 Protein ClpV1 [Oligella urethralis]SUA52300.1 protein disaggregation chaperone [Oligella urethralis]
MSEINRADLFAKLNPTLYRALEGATAFCKLRGNPYVELVHWLHQLMHEHDTDIQKILRYFEIRPEDVEQGIIVALEELPQGASSISDLSEHIDNATERAWVYGSLKYGDARIRSAYLMLGILKSNSSRNVLYGISPAFKKIIPDVLADKLNQIVKGSAEDHQTAALRTDETGTAAASTGGGGQPSALAQYAVDMTERARNNEIDPVSGRDEEIRQMVDILMRRRQNNPLLTGEAGVGKTAVVEGFALRLAKGDVPESLRDISLYLLDIGLLQAGASMKGEFESRLRAVIDEVQASEKPIVLFIDEIHTLIGAGGAAGTGDAANLLKPALARGELRTIGATTWAEYKKYIEKDPALTRRFQTIQVHEPDEKKALIMLRGLVDKLEAHHQVLLLDEAVEAAVKLSHRYIPARQLPDKAVALLDTACARVAVSQYAQPAALEDLNRKIEHLTVEKGIAERELALGLGEAARIEAIEQELKEAETQQLALQAAWEAEQRLASELFELRRSLREASELSEEARAEMLQRVQQLQEELLSQQGEQPLIFPAVDGAAVAAVVADWTGIPVGRMVKDQANSILHLATTLEQRVIGQSHALTAIAERIQTSRAKLTDPNKPVAVFMLCGPSGVGKTETALALAETLYGGEQNLITINMSEFQEAHTVSTLKGAPPGYVGYGEGGVLTEAVRRRPYSVVLLDEVEKAHADVHEMFFQVFDKGWMEDGEGRYIDFKNTVIILTSNVGTERIMEVCKDPELMPDAEGLAAVLREPLLNVFPAALLGRLAVVPYFPLSDDMLAKIVDLQLARVQKRLAEHHGIELVVAPEAVQLIVDRCTEVESGGRMVDAILNSSVLPKVSRRILEAAMAGDAIQRLSLSAEDSEFVFHYS